MTGDGPHRRGTLFWVSAGVGWAVIGFGLRGLFHHHIDTRPAELGRFLFGGLLAHDLVFAPLVLAAGLALARAVPGRCRAPAQAALLISGLVALFAYPQVRNYARVLHNPTSLPHNYTANLAAVVAAVCCTTALVAVTRTRRPGPRP